MDVQGRRQGGGGGGGGGDLSPPKFSLRENIKMLTVVCECMCVYVCSIMQCV